MRSATGCSHLVFGSDLSERAQALRKALPALKCLGLGVATADVTDLLAAAEAQLATPLQIDVAHDDVVLTLFTSGTTGTLKAARHTQASYAAICRNVLLNLLPATPDDAMLHAASLTFGADGWVRTRDIGVFDADGFLYLKDRTSDMIISGGYNVYPSEVENVLLADPAVLECAVIGLLHEKWVEVVTAVVVLRQGQEVTESELIAHVADRLASYKKPQKIIRVDVLPKTAVGKLNRKQLREHYGQA